ncbi:hypothetical protein YC2023_122216 [Brassica napus]
MDKGVKMGIPTQTNPYPNGFKLIWLHAVDLRGRIRRMDPKLSSVLSSLPTAVEYSLVMRREGSGFRLGVA